MLQVKCDKVQVTLCKWKERLSKSSKGEWIHLLIQNLKVWLGKGRGQIDFYLTLVMSGHGLFSVYLFCMKLVKSPECGNCNKRGWDDPWHTLFDYLAFQQFQDETMTTQQEMCEEPLIPYSLVPIMLRSVEGWNKVAAFVALAPQDGVKCGSGKDSQFLQIPSTQC